MTNPIQLGSEPAITITGGFPAITKGGKNQDGRTVSPSTPLTDARKKQQLFGIISTMFVRPDFSHL